MSSTEDLFDFIRNGSGNGMEKDLWARYGTRCAMMVLDSSGFTKSTRKSGIVSFLRSIVQMRDLIDGLLSNRSCISRRAAADNYYAEFHTADDALDAAIEVQRAMEAGMVSVDGGNNLAVCIGIGFGDVLASGSEGMYGDEMNLASKLGEDLAGRGDILLTASAFSSLTEGRKGGFSRRETIIAGVTLEYYQFDISLAP